jgi:hypothetical protein
MTLTSWSIYSEPVRVRQMRQQRPRFKVRRTMVTVAIAGVAMGWAVYARNMLHQSITGKLTMESAMTGKFGRF